MWKGKKDKDAKAAGGKQRGARGERTKPSGGLAGMMGMDPSMGVDMGGDDDDFEAELAKLTGMGGKSGKGKVCHELSWNLGAPLIHLL